jgi:hypothetical protein
VWTELRAADRPHAACPLVALQQGGVRDVISRHRQKKFRSQRVRDRFATNETDEDLVVTLKQTPSYPESRRQSFARGRRALVRC